jgi:hypothetical protein
MPASRLVPRVASATGLKIQAQETMTEIQNALAGLRLKAGSQTV